MAEDIFQRGVCLPSGSTLSFADQKRVVDVVRGCAAKPTIKLDQPEVVDLTDQRLTARGVAKLH